MNYCKFVDVVGGRRTPCSGQSAPIATTVISPLYFGGLRKLHPQRQADGAVIAARDIGMNLRVVHLVQQVR